MTVLLSDKLRELRAKAGLTQAALAERCGLPLGNVRNYEQGIRHPSWDTMFKLADALGVDCRVFKDCKPTPPKAKSPAPKRGRKPTR